MALSQTLLREPVSRDDILDHEETLDNLRETHQDMINRLLMQYGQNTWISDEMAQIYFLLDQAHTRLSNLRGTNCFPDI